MSDVALTITMDGGDVVKLWVAVVVMGVLFWLVSR